MFDDWAVLHDSNRNSPRNKSTALLEIRDLRYLQEVTFRSVGIWRWFTIRVS